MAKIQLCRFPHTLYDSRLLCVQVGYSILLSHRLDDLLIHRYLTFKDLSPCGEGDRQHAETASSSFYITVLLHGKNESAWVYERLLKSKIMHIRRFPHEATVGFQPKAQDALTMPLSSLCSFVTALCIYTISCLHHVLPAV